MNKKVGDWWLVLGGWWQTQKGKAKVGLSE
jgi:hypothetical protein